MANMHEIVKKHIEAAKAVEIAATAKMDSATAEKIIRRFSLSLHRLGKEYKVTFKPGKAKRQAGAYLIPVFTNLEGISTAASKALIKKVLALGGPKPFKVGDFMVYMNDVFDSSGSKLTFAVMAETADEYAKNRAPTTAPAGKKPAAPAAGKAPKGTGKLKAFLKENGIDAKTLKAMAKFIK